MAFGRRPGWFRRTRRLTACLAVGAAGLAVGPVDGAAAATCDRWMAPTGSDGADGSSAAPWRSIEHAATAVPDGCTVWIRPGVYRGSQDIARRFSATTTFRAETPYSAVLEHTGSVMKIDGARNVVVRGLELRHVGPGSTGYLVLVNPGDGNVAEDIVLRDNIIHDSYDEDLIKVHHGSRRVTVVGNLLYNQGPSEQHMDINGVTDVTVQDNVMFNDYARSGRTDAAATAKHFIIVKDSNAGEDGFLGSRRVAIRRNVFVNFQGGHESFVKIGNDGKPYHEADGVDVANNLFVGNSPVEAHSSFGVAGARNVTFRNNTVVGDLPSSAYAFRLEAKDDNPRNQDIAFVNNIWSDPTGTMDDFSRGGGVADTIGLRLRSNLYWNGGRPVPGGDPVSPSSDPARVVADPRLPGGAVSLPLRQGSGFRSGSATIRQEFIRLVEAHGRPASSVVVGAADAGEAPSRDIFGRARDRAPDLGAYEVGAGPVGTSVEARWPNGTIYRLYRAYFLRDPDDAGYRYWADRYAAGYPLTAISDDFSRSAEFRARYGDLQGGDFVTLVYRNVLRREPDRAGYDYWVDQMRRGMTRGVVMINFSDSAEFRAATGT